MYLVTFQAPIGVLETKETETVESHHCGDNWQAVAIMKWCENNHIAYSVSRVTAPISQSIRESQMGVFNPNWIRTLDS